MTAGGPEDPRPTLVPLFAAEAARRLETLEEGLAQDVPDYRSLVREAHTLRGSAAVLGLERIGEEAGLLETALAQAGSGRAALDLAAAREAIARLRVLLARVPGQPEPGPVESAGGTATPTRLVLCVEDSPANARLVARVLRAREDVAVLSAASGAEACRLAAEHRPAVVLLDLQLPDMSGEEVVRHLAGRAETRTVPVVVVTGGADQERLGALRALGVRDVLLKPYSPADLLVAVDAALAYRPERGTGSPETGTTLTPDVT